MKTCPNCAKDRPCLFNANALAMMNTQKAFRCQSGMAAMKTMDKF